MAAQQQAKLSTLKMAALRKKIESIKFHSFQFSVRTTTYNIYSSTSTRKQIRETKRRTRINCASR